MPEMASEDWYINELGKDLDKVCSTIKDRKNLICASVCPSDSSSCKWQKSTVTSLRKRKKREFSGRKLKNHKNIKEQLKTKIQEKKVWRQLQDLDIRTHRLFLQGALDYAWAPWTSVFMSVLCTPNSWNWVSHRPILVLRQLWQDPRTQTHFWNTTCRCDLALVWAF